MKKLLISLMVLLVVITGLALTGCERVPLGWQDGEALTKTYDYQDFTKIEIGYAFDLEVLPGEDYSITITAGERVMERVEVEKTGSTLKIGLKGWSFNILRSPKAVITMPVLEGLSLSGASSGVAHGFSGTESFSVIVSGASDLEMSIETGQCKLEVTGASRVSGSIEADETDILVSGASDLTLNGKGGNSMINGSGASTLNMYEFQVDDADIILSGATTGRVNVTGRLDANVSGASTLRHTGNPELGSIDISGGSSIHPK